MYTRISDIINAERLLAADLYCHKSCISGYKLKYKQSKNDEKTTVSKTPKRILFQRHISFFKEILNKGNGICLSEIRDIINGKEDAVFTNSEIKSFLNDFLGAEIQFCQSPRKNESMFVFPSSITMEDVMNKVRNLSNIQTAAKTMRSTFLDHHFGLEDKFCDAEELRKNTVTLPDEILTFFAALFNVKKACLMPNYYEDSEHNRY